MRASSSRRRERGWPGPGMRGGTRTIADKIFVINNGMLENSGKHEELLEKSKLYCAMCMASNKEDEA